MNVLARTRIGSAAFGVSAAGFAIAGWLFLSRLHAGLPSPVSGGALALVAVVLSVVGVCCVDFDRGAAFWLGALFIVSGIAVLSGLVLLKTGWGGETNIGAGAVYVVGVYLMPVVAIIAIIAAIVGWTKRPKNSLS